MKELVFMTGPDCPMSVEMEDKVILFEELNPDIKVTRLSAVRDDEEFNKKSNGYSLTATPTFVALEDDKVLEIHEGRACEVRLLKMFSPESIDDSSEENIKNDSESAKIILFFGSSWCVATNSNELFCNQMSSTMDEFSKINSKIDILQIDVELESHLVPENCYGQPIKNLPTIFWIKNNEFVKSFEGFFELEDLINLTS